MTDLFSSRSALPMLLGISEPFDSENFIYELKFDGIRCLAYLDDGGVVLRNRKNNDMTAAFPELSEMNKYAKEKVIIDGELVCLKDGKPDFYSVQSRLLTRPNKETIEKNGAVFVAFDILYRKNAKTTNEILERRKELLEKVVSESEKVIISKYIETEGKAFFSLIKERELEGIVAKRKGSFYYMGRRSDDWLKIKRINDEEFAVCGYTVYDDGRPKDLILGSLDGEKMRFGGKVFLGIRPSDRDRLEKAALAYSDRTPVFNLPKVKAVWLKPLLKCKVEYLEKTESGLRQPVFRGFIDGE